MSKPLTPKARLEALLALINSAAHDAISEYERVGDVPSIDTVHPLDTASASLALRKAVRVMEGACEQLITTLAPPSHTLIKRAWSHLEPTCLEVVIEANVAGILADHHNGLSLADIGAKAGIRPDKLGRFMRFLATQSCFKEVRKDVFQNNRLSSRLVANTNIADIFLFHSRDLQFPGAYAWLTGPKLGLADSPDKTAFSSNIKGAEQSTFYAWLQDNPDREAFFGSAQLGVNEAFGDSDKLAQNYPFDSLPPGATFCDVGSGIGSMCVRIANTYPLHVTLQDQPSLREESQHLLDAQCPGAVRENRIDIVPIDFLKESPVKDQDIYYVYPTTLLSPLTYSDIYYKQLRHIVHNWPDSDAIRILKNVRAAMKPDSRLLLHDEVLANTDPAEPSTAPEPLPANYGAGNILSYYNDLTMMNLFNSQERTLAEFRALGVAAGLEFVNLWDLGHQFIVEFKIYANEDRDDAGLGGSDDTDEPGEPETAFESFRLCTGTYTPELDADEELDAREEGRSKLSRSRPVLGIGDEVGADVLSMESKEEY
ncbi:S-adenosyl-L-methionine-dependent methyltransferase [Athelia psychrophila]|uniref:S-adenosyl-L-methionine-dependent methyltransferase n=1 Tax=Athelia psychrophila TaxID=1759441 RepID=A0A166FLB0_9AGAM|nr:S-adenosyl-L-methionine-dependent methyltransferase [Fibularhizoctonia sp. CBS 109695]